MDNNPFNSDVLHNEKTSNITNSNLLLSILTQLKAHYWTYNSITNKFEFSPSLSQLLPIPSKKMGINILLNNIHPEDKTQIQKSLNNIIKNRNAKTLYYRIKTQRNNYIYIENKFMLAGSPDGSYQIVSTLQEIHGKKEEPIPQKPESKPGQDTATASFLATMAHEMRAPMNGILGFAELLENRQISEEKHKKYISIIKNSSKHLMALLSDILALSKLESNQIRLNIEECSFNMLCTELSLYFFNERKRLNKEDISIIFEEQPIAFDLINTDITKLKQILTNLIENALKYTNCGYIKINHQINANKYHQFTVTDTGVGIPEDKKHCVFQRFIRLHSNYLNNRPTGSGLGLSITKSLVETLGGQIWFESQINKGTSFHFTLPLDEHISESSTSACINGQPLNMLQTTKN